MHKSACLNARAHCPFIHNAIMKYGWTNFKSEVLVEVSNDLLNHYEKVFIDLYGTYGKFGYNLTPGGDQPPQDERTKRKRVEGLKRAHADPLKQARYRRGWKAAQSKPESRQKQREIQLVAQNRASANDKRSASVFAKLHDTQTRMKHLEALKRTSANPSVNAKRSETLKATLKRNRELRARGLPVPISKKERLRQRTIARRGTASTASKCEMEHKNNVQVIESSPMTSDIFDTSITITTTTITRTSVAASGLGLGRRRTRPGSQYATEEEDVSSESSDEEASVNWAALHRGQVLRAHRLLRG